MGEARAAEREEPGQTRAERDDERWRGRHGRVERLKQLKLTRALIIVQVDGCRAIEEQPAAWRAREGVRLKNCEAGDSGQGAPVGSNSPAVGVPELSVGTWTFRWQRVRGWDKALAERATNKQWRNSRGQSRDGDGNY